MTASLIVIWTYKFDTYSNIETDNWNWNWKKNDNNNKLITFFAASIIANLEVHFIITNKNKFHERRHLKNKAIHEI